jgi:RHH-type proline utilization regulon transcriptional repressor/proline dehydrogenase/delta 1-pyrroline-5-carboxylate dehydrogenase
MLGEGARTYADAERYFQSYLAAINALKRCQKHPFNYDKEISIKLSSLHPRFEALKWRVIEKELYPKLFKLCQAAKAGNVRILIDAEQSDRTSLTLNLFAHLLLDPYLKGFDKLGIVVQSYQKRSCYVIDFLNRLSKKAAKKIPVRLVKGAYWDEEIKREQREGLDNYRVFTQKNNSDLMYLLCANKILSCHETLYGQFATHNIQTILMVQSYAAMLGVRDYEFQRLYGMGQEVYHYLTHNKLLKSPVRIYAPIGNRVDLLSYLVRRLMENGVSNSYLTQTLNSDISVQSLIQNPLRILANDLLKKEKLIVLPSNIFQPNRKNSRGIDLSSLMELDKLKQSLREKIIGKTWTVSSIIGGKVLYEGESKELYSPIRYDLRIGKAYQASERHLLQACYLAHHEKEEWAVKGFHLRAEIIEKIADLIEEKMDYFIGLLLLESGKTFVDAIAEVREAIDFCRYYARNARDYIEPCRLRGYAGEENYLVYEPKGVFVCISPWNFPLAIFLGQIVAALVMGNTVLAKPSGHSSIIASEVIQLMHHAGVSKNALHLLLCSGSKFSNTILEAQEIDGVCFTGSTDTAFKINTVLSKKKRIVPLIAETGGLNAMIVDSTCLLEQTTDAIIQSAFQSAGQRCSALRMLYIQEDIADDLIKMIKGAMDTLAIGHPFEESTDIGPVISYEAKIDLKKTIADLDETMTLLHKLNPLDDIPAGPYFMPHLIETSGIHNLKKETFGPILYVARYSAGQEKKIINEINQTGYGLTFGIHSRNQRKAEALAKEIQAGNVYINEGTIGAIVGVQPFGGRRLSGTGPKAGGPNYLKAFVNEKCITNNTAAIGGIPDLYT